MKRFNYYYPLPFSTHEEYYPVEDNENPGYKIHVRREDEAQQLVDQLNTYEDTVKQLKNEILELKKNQFKSNKVMLQMYLKEDKLISFDVIKLIFERHIMEIHDHLNKIGCNKYNDIETYERHMDDIHLMDRLLKEILLS